jgi:protein-tyrosine phosphatase
VIDLHCHILPGLDDGPATIDACVALARLAAADGTRTVVATPHVREDYHFEFHEIADRAQALNARLIHHGVPVEVEVGAEIALSQVPSLNQASLELLCLGSEGRSMLVESPYQQVTETLEHTLFNLQLAGFYPVLAHPERSPTFMRDPERLARIVDRGILCSVTAASMAGRFGRTVQRFTRVLFERGLVHDVASDAHDIGRRAPSLTGGFRILDRELPGILGHIEWFTTIAPAAILAGDALPAQPVIRPPRRLPRVLHRRG